MAEPEVLAAGPGWRGRLGQWGRILSAYFASQGLAQLLSVAAGLLLARSMPVAEFALYTLAASVVAFYGFFSDLGSTGSLVYFFQVSRKQGEDFGAYLGAVRWLRSRAFLLGAALVAVALPWMALAKGFGLGEALLATAAVAANVWAQIVASIRVLTLRLRGLYARSYRADVAGGAVRLVGVLALIALGLLRAFLAVGVSALALAAVAGLGKAPEPEPAAAPPEARRARRAVMRYLLPTLPSALYFSIQGQLTVWLAATFGATENLAQVGALSRLGMVMSLFSGLTSVIFLPRLAAITSDRLYRRRSLQFGALLAGLGAALLAVAAAAPRPFLLILGANYQGLDRELVLVVAGAALTLLGGYAVAINSARSWNRWQTPLLVLHLAGQVALITWLPLSTTRGVLLFGCGTAAVGLLLQAAVLAVGFVRPKWVHWQ
ncbi:MAG TPA: hypothetical protein VF017_22695 [Thermoanaerobaculia bacterium]|nr:hypothetical protein [Thermoanaerobaculia bacterium]